MQTPNPEEENIEKIVSDIKLEKVKLYIGWSLAGIVLIYLMLFLILPSFYLSVEGLRQCPNNFQNFKNFCHSVQYPASYWQSNVYDIMPSNGKLFIGVTAARNLKQIDSKLFLPFKYTAKIAPLGNLDATPVTSAIKSINGENFIRCHSNKIYCHDTILAVENWVYYENYQVFVSFDIDARSKSDYISEIYFFVYTLNSNYDLFVQITKIFLFIGSIVGLVCYQRSFKCGIPNPERSYEKGFIIYLSILLIILNTPFIWFNILRKALFLTSLSVFYVQMYRRVCNVGEILFQTLTLRLVRAAIVITLLYVIIMIMNLSYLEKGFSINPDAYELEPGRALIDKSIVILLALVFFCLFNLMIMVNSLRAVLGWAKVTPNHRLFMIWNSFLLLMGYLFGLFSIYQPMNNEGVNQFILLLLANFFVFSNQILFRFTRGNDLNSIPVSEKEKVVSVSEFPDASNLNESKNSAGDIVLKDESVEPGKELDLVNLNKTESEILVNQNISKEKERAVDPENLLKPS